MITKQQQLEFAAKHIEKWKSGYDYAVVEETADGHLYVRWPSVCTSGITKNEWRQEREKMQKQHDFDIGSNLKVSVTATSNGFGEMKTNTLWYERGELPPVGCECEWVDESGIDGPDGALYPCIGDVVSVCAHRETPGGEVIAIFTWPHNNGLLVAASRMPSDFRPIRTEREKAIEEMANLIAKSVFGSAKCQAEKLYDSGYRKVE